MYAERVLSGMRPTGALHLGHYHGVLKNWVKLQHEHPCLFFVADWHALTTCMRQKNFWPGGICGMPPGQHCPEYRSARRGENG